MGKRKKKRKINRIGQILRRNCLLKHIIEGMIERGVKVTTTQGKRSKQLLDDLTEKRGYCKLKEEALHRTVWRTCFGKDLCTCRKTDCAVTT